jgi:hypothetical protein
MMMNQDADGDFNIHGVSSQTVVSLRVDQVRLHKRPSDGDGDMVC